MDENTSQDSQENCSKSVSVYIIENGSESTSDAEMASSNVDNGFLDSNLYQKAKRSSFQITRVVNKEGVANTEEDKDEKEDTTTGTDDIGSDLTDTSRTTDVVTDVASVDGTVYSLSPVDDLLSPDCHPQLELKENYVQSRFKLVKINNKETVKRGRWLCLNFVDPVRLTKADRSFDEIGYGSGSSSTGSSVHCTQGVDQLSRLHVCCCNGHESHHLLAVGAIHANSSSHQLPLFTNGLESEFSTFPCADAMLEFQNLELFSNPSLTSVSHVNSSISSYHSADLTFFERDVTGSVSSNSIRRLDVISIDGSTDMGRRNTVADLSPQLLEMTTASNGLDLNRDDRLFELFIEFMKITKRVNFIQETKVSVLSL